MSDNTAKCANVCGFCKAKALKKCSACRQVCYCSREHQKLDWKTHKLSCKPFLINYNVIKGKFLSASRDIKIDEIILKEKPLIIGPKFVLPSAVCLGCLKPITCVVSSPKCSVCKWPLCNLQCDDIQNHKIECALLSKQSENRALTLKYRYELITPLRCILQKQNNEAKWNSILNMEAHTSHRSEGSEIYKEIEELYSYLREYILKNQVEYDISSNEFHRVCGILDVNSLDVPYGSVELSALYLTFSNIEHSCVPNVKLLFNKFDVIVKAVKPISNNENLSTTYTNILWGTHMRQQHLYSTKYFICSCIRCKDPTELGTNFSSIKCLQDNCLGYLRLCDPLCVESSWSCNDCKFVMPSKDMNDILSGLTAEVDQIQEEKSPKVKDIETLLEKLLSVLHPHHYCCFSLIHTLIQLYGHESGYSYSVMDDKLLKKKIDHCKELLFILSRLDYSGSRVPLYTAITNYEFAAAKLEEIKRTLVETKNLTSVLEEGKEAMSLLFQAIALLRDEKFSTINFQFSQSCRNLRAEIQNTLNIKQFVDVI